MIVIELVLVLCALNVVGLCLWILMLEYHRRKKHD